MTGSQLDVGSDINSISYLQTPQGFRHADNQLLAVASGNGDRTKCTRLTTSEFRPYSVGSGPALYRFTVPNAVDFDPDNDAQAFFVAYKDGAGDITVYFSTDSTNTSIYYNKYLSTGSWVHASSPIAVHYNAYQGAIAVGDVIVETYQAFYNAADGLSYRQIMFITNQTDEWFDTTWGVVDVAFSNDGETWTSPSTINYPSPIYAEDVGVIWNGSNLIILAVEGLFANQLLAGAMVSGSTLTYAWIASASSPTVASQPFPGSTINGAGIEAYNASGFTPSKILWNCSFCYSIDYSVIYMTRGYAYASDYPYGPGVIGSDVPCGVTNDCGDGGDKACCATGIITYPNRVQVYSMTVGNDITKLVDGTTPWSLIYDMGFGMGYRCCR